MFGAESISERKADSETLEVYHEIQQTLRIDGVNLIFQVLAANGTSLSLLWSKAKPGAQTLEFEEATDELRRAATKQLHRFQPLGAAPKADLGAGQSFRIRKAIDTYRYLTPKLLVLVSRMRLAMQGQLTGAISSTEGTRSLRKGIPTAMFPLEMESKKPKDKEMQQIFDESCDLLGSPQPNSYFRSFALWPDYLKAYWKELKPVIQGSQYKDALSELQAYATHLASELPEPFSISPEEVKEHKADHAKILEKLQSFEKVIAAAIINVNLAGLDWVPTTELEQSPFPLNQGGHEHELANL